MSLRLIGTTYQADFYVAGKRHQPRLKATDEVAAQKELEVLIAELKAKAPAADEDRKPWTLNDAYERVYARVWKDSKSVKTVEKNARQMFKHFKKTDFIDDIDTNSIDRWVAKLKEQGNSNGTVNRKLALLSKLLTFAKSRSKLVDKPHIEKMPEGIGRIRYLSFDEERTILTTFKQWSQDLHDFVIILLDVGARCGEAYRIEARDVDIEHNLLSVWENKASLPRSVPMTLRVSEVFKRRLETTKVGRMFPFKSWWLEKQWAKLRVIMGLQDDIQFVPHCLRHTCATRLVQKGVPLLVVKEWMGHKTIKVTMGYAHLCPANLQEGMKALNSIHAVQFGNGAPDAG